MKAEQVDKALHQKFVTEGERLVFWHDPNSEFADYVENGLTGEIADVQVLDVEKVGGLSAKLRLEYEDKSGNYLIYSKGEAPLAEEDWLLDIRLYSAQFHADVASLWLQELGLSSLSLRDHLKARAAFFGSQDRSKKLAKFVETNDDEAALDLKMMAVLVGSAVASPFEVLRALCHDHSKDTDFDLSKPPIVITTFEKMGLLGRFWELMRTEFFYSSSTPSIAGLLRKLFISELFHQTNGQNLASLAHHQLPPDGQRNAVVFLTQWRDSSGNASSYDATATAVAAEQKVGAALAVLDLENVREIYTFWDAEKRIIFSLKERLLEDADAVNLASVRELAGKRKTGHWLSGPGSDAPDRRAIAKAYDAIVSAAELFVLRKEHRNAMTFENPGDALNAYQKRLHRFDTLYRSFSSQAKPAQGQGWDLLKTLADEVERVYDQGFLQPFGVEWSRLLDKGFLDQWSLPDLPAQQNFYADNISPHLAESPRKRAFVIISDAFRYEAAKEFTDTLNGTYRMDAKLSAMLGVLPSYTALGMASLLPHKTLAYTVKGDVLVDGNSSASANRSKQLETVQGMACQATDLRAMKWNRLANSPKTNGSSTSTTM